MSVDAKFIRDIDPYFQYPTDENPTTQQEYQEAVRNWVTTEEAIVDSHLWQPTTNYNVGNQIKTPSLPPQCVLVCTAAGTSGNEEPDYTNVDVGDSVTDGTVTWLVSEAITSAGGTMTGNITLADGGKPLSTAGGEMSGDIELKAGIKAEDWSETYQFPVSVTSRYGIKGTYPVDRNIVFPLCIARDGSDKISDDEKCRYSLFETQLFPNGCVKTIIRTFKNEADATSSVELRMENYPSGNSYISFANKDLERVNSSGSNYIRFESGLQIVFDKISLNGSTSYVMTYTYPVAFVGNVTLATGNRWAANNEQVSVQNDSTTKFEVNVTNAGSNPHNMFFISIGKWK